MKKLLLLAVMSYGITVQGQIKMNTNGNVSIGGSPNTTYKLSVSGASYFGGTSQFSGTSHFTATSYFTKIHMYDLDIGDYASLVTTGTYVKYFAPSSGNSGYLGTPTNRFSTIYCINLDESSDSTKKENIKPFKNSLDKIMQLNAYKYDVKSDFLLSPEMKQGCRDKNVLDRIEKERKNKIGLMAQQVKKVLPEVVNIDDSTGILSISYTRIIPVLIEAIKEQQVVIERLQADLDKLSKKSNPNARQLDEDNTETEMDSNNWILQNTPNPTNGATQIGYSVFEGTSSAHIYVYDMQGTQLKSYTVSGSGSLTIQSSEFKAGMYMYGLVVNGQLVDSKKMVLTK